MKVEFLRSVVVEGKSFKPGDIAEAGGQSLSYFESCVRMGHAQKLEEAKQNGGGTNQQGKK